MNFLSIAIDGAALLAYFYLVPVLANRMAHQGGWNAGIILAAYFIMCAGILIARQLEPNPDYIAATPRAETETRLPAHPVVIWLCWPFSIFVCVMMAMAAGVFEKNSQMGLLNPNPETWLLALFIIGFLVILLLFPMLLLLPIHTKVGFSSSLHPLLRSLSVLLVDCMVLVTTAFWEWQFKDTEPMQIALAGRIFVFVFAYIFFLMFYAPPRLAILSLEHSQWSIGSFLTMLGIMVWRFIK